MKTIKRAGITVLVLVGVAVVLVVVFLTKDLVKTTSTTGKSEIHLRGTVEAQKLFRFAAGDIRQLDIAIREVNYSEAAPSQPAKERQLGLARVGDKWVLTQPMHALAAKGEAEGLANAVASLDVAQGFEANPHDPEYGLDNPCVIVRIKAKGGKEFELRIGKDTAIESKVYLWLGGKTIYTAASSLKTSLIKQPGDLREKKVADFEEGKVKRLLVDRDNVRVVCEQEGKKGKGEEWWLIQPVRAEADNYAVKDVVNAVKGLEAKEFVDSPKSLSEYGLDNPQLMAWVDFGKGKDPVVVTFGKKITKSVTSTTPGAPGATATSSMEMKNLVYCAARGRDEVFLVDADVIDKIGKKPIDLRDKNIIDFTVTDVQGVSVVNQSGGANFEVVKKEGKWSLTKPIANAAATSKVEDILWNLKDIKAEDFLDKTEVSLADAGLTSPMTTVTLTIKGKSEPLVISFGRQEPNGTRTYLRTSAMAKPVLVNKSAIDALPKSVDALKETAASTTTMPSMPSGPSAPPMGAPPMPAGSMKTK